MKLAKKVVLITGSSRGIGRSIALLFAQEGADIALHCHTHKKENDLLAKEISEKYGRKVAIFPADLSQIKHIKLLVSKVIKKFGRIDILINNAAAYPENGFFQSTEASWDRIIDTNLKGPYFLSQIVGKLMLEQKSGNIINMASVAGLFPRKSSFEYAISKAGLIQFSKSLALVMAPYVRVNALAPSYTWSDFMSFMKDPKKVKDKMKLVPLKRFNDPEDVAKSALFLACDDSRNITGQVLVLDGGRGAAI